MYPWSLQPELPPPVRTYTITTSNNTGGIDYYPEGYYAQDPPEPVLPPPPEPAGYEFEFVGEVDVDDEAVMRVITEGLAALYQKEKEREEREEAIKRRGGQLEFDWLKLAVLEYPF